MAEGFEGSCDELGFFFFLIRNENFLFKVMYCIFSKCSRSFHGWFYGMLVIQKVLGNKFLYSYK